MSKTFKHIPKNADVMLDADRENRAMQYPLEEKIGVPELLVGRVEEFAFFHKWFKKMPRKLFKSHVILARRKSGKTSFVQRIFNQLWSENGKVIPFYLDIEDKDIWYPQFAAKYYRAFANQYISFLERDPDLIRRPLRLDQIADYGVQHNIVALAEDASYIMNNITLHAADDIWDIASHAPHRYGALYDQRFLVILDEFQNIARHVYRNEHGEGKPDDSMPGSFHSLSESKVAPMLVTGSYPGILRKIMAEYLEAGRLSEYILTPSLKPQEGLEAVYKYAEVYEEPITPRTAEQINELCWSDPFFISCVILSRYPKKDLTTTDGVIQTVEYEITYRRSEMSKTWAEYIRKTFERVNGPVTKSLMLFLNKHDKQYWRPHELKKELNLELSTDEIFKRLELLAESDVIIQGSSDIQFRGLRDGTLNLVLRHRFEEEIEGFEPDFKTEFQAQLAEAKTETNKWRGKANYWAGMLAERSLAIELRSKKHLRLSDYFTEVDDNRLLNLIDVRERSPYQRTDGKSEEIDILAYNDNGDVVMIEVRNRKERTDLKAVTDLHDNAQDYAQQHGVVVLSAFLSLGGFTDDAKTFCQKNRIGMSDELSYI